MSVFMIVNASLNKANSQALQLYSERSLALFKHAGARPFEKFSPDELVVGADKPDLVSITEWPSKESILKVFESEDYKALLSLRDQAFSKLDVFISK